MLDQYTYSLLAFALIQIIGLVVPGPDLLVTLHNSASYGRKFGFATALGIACGTLIHSAYIIAGFDLFILKSKMALWIFKLLGSCYIIYSGSEFMIASKESSKINKLSRKNITIKSAFIRGLLTNLFNLGAALYFVSMFGSLTKANTPVFIMQIYAAIIFSTSIVWFGFVAFMFTTQRVQKKFDNYIYYFEKITGFILIIMGASLLF